MANTAVMRRTHSPPEESGGAFIPRLAEPPLLEGNPTGATGAYALRLKMPDNYKIADLAESAADIPATPGPRLFCLGY